MRRYRLRARPAVIACSLPGVHPGSDPEGFARDLGGRAHRDAWLHGYRGVLGFATLVLADALPTRLS